MPFPGTSELFVFSSDVLAMVAGTTHRAAAQEFLNTVATEEAQLAVNAIRGTLPALRDIDVNDLQEGQRATYDHFLNAAARLPAVHGFKSDEVMPELAMLEKRMIEFADASELKAYIAANYGLAAVASPKPPVYSIDEIRLSSLRSPSARGSICNGCIRLGGECMKGWRRSERVLDGRSC